MEKDWKLGYVITYAFVRYAGMERKGCPLFTMNNNQIIIYRNIEDAERVMAWLIKWEYERKELTTWTRCRSAFKVEQVRYNANQEGIEARLR